MVNYPSWEETGRGSREVALKSFLKQIKESKVNGLDVYQLGVNTANTMIHISSLFYDNNISIRKYFGFDTFTGMPNEPNENVEDKWKPGAHNALEYHNVNTIEQCLEKIYAKLNNNPWEYNYYLIPGLAEETVCLENMNKYDFGPALLIDVDFDIYTPTKHTLKFMLKNNIIIEGTYIFYDDWGGVRAWETMSAGEPRAHKEITEEFNIKWEELAQVGNSYPHIQKLFRVRSLNLKSSS